MPGAKKKGPAPLRPSMAEWADGWTAKLWLEERSSRAVDSCLNLAPKFAPGVFENRSKGKFSLENIFKINGRGDRILNLRFLRPECSAPGLDRIAEDGID
jgi:hypothetical protein